ncbi:MAG: glycosyltransferase [Dissulfurispiraceae bacterium]|jgi:GT2 family glycosyltransferase|nr:glycosyltransferase [Dissulfurispiraceae bacterium]
MMTVIIPTRSRPDDLIKAIASVINQIRQPDELVIVDQSIGDESHLAVEKLLRQQDNIILKYIHDSAISGLVEAKQIGVAVAGADIICFLEDDIVLEREYLYEIEKGFCDIPKMKGCCGVVTNPPKRSGFYNMFFKLFRRGIFADNRMDVFIGNSNGFIQSNVLSGGLSAWKSEVFKVIKFDVVNGFFMLEDMEFSTRAAKHFGGLLYINPKARLAHYCSSVNREGLGHRYQRKVVEYIMYYKKRKQWTGAHFDIAWLLFGLMWESLAQVFLKWSVRPFIGYVGGLMKGITKRVNNII